MKKYTLRTIKRTTIYRANVEAVRAIWPEHVEDFARELKVAANHLISNGGNFRAENGSLICAFGWMHTPQGADRWADLNIALDRYELKGAENELQKSN